MITTQVQDQIICPPQMEISCAWCNEEQGQPQGEGSHGICDAHAEVEYEKYKASKAVYGTCGHLAKSEDYSCGSPNCSQYSW